MADVPSKKQILAQLRAQIDRIEQGRGVDAFAEEDLDSHVEPYGIEKVVPGKEKINAHGACYVADAYFDLAEFHGNHRFRELIDTDMGLISKLGRDDRLEKLDPTRALFLDIETTGLSPFEGAFSFLTGVAWYEPERLVVRQIFTRTCEEEPAALYELARLVKKFSHLVTFNGRGFDVPVLSERLRINRMDQSISIKPHLDLLVPTRRIFKGVKSDCRLGTMEEILGFHRTGDVPSSEIPALYASYLRSRDARKLAKVFEHNLYDVLTMAVLQARIAAMLEQGEEDDLPPEQLFGLGRALILCGLNQRGEMCIETAAPDVSGPMRAKALKETAALYKKRKDYKRAIPFWAELTAMEPESIKSFQELAIYFEHHAKDFDKALEVIDAAFLQVVFSSYSAKLSWQKRRDRVEKKKEKADR